MNNSALDPNIGKKVISASFGEGIIAEITEMSGEPFYIVLNQSNNMKHYVPINDSNAYRYISSEEKFLITIDKYLINGEYNLEFDSKKDRINYYKDESKIQTLSSICQNIKTLHQTEDRGSLEEQIYQRLIENLALEYGLIKQANQEQAFEFIQTIIQKI